MQMIDTPSALGFYVILYSVAVVAYGLYKSKNTSSTATEFHLANREIGPWPTGLSGAASAESGWVLLGLVGSAYAGGVSTLWLIPGCVAGNLFNWFVVGPRLRNATQLSGAMTIPEFLARGVTRSDVAVRLVAAVVTLVFMLAYVSAQFTAVGKALSATLGMEYVTGVVLGCVFVLVYLVAGGMRSSIWTDTLQAAFVIGTLVVLPLTAAVHLEPTDWAELRGQDGLFHTFGGANGWAAVGFAIGWLGIGLGYPGQPHILSRFLGCRDAASIRIAGIIATVWSTVVLLGAIAVGLVARAQVPGLEDPENALMALTSDVLPLPLAAFALAAILAAICSTADSQLLAAAAVVSNDLLRLDPQAESRWPRVVVCLLGVLACVFAATQTRVVFDFVLYAWAGLGATLGPAVITKLLRENVSSRRILLGMIGGLVTVLAWSSSPTLSSLVYELVPGFVVALLLMNAFTRKGHAAAARTSSTADHEK